MSEEEIQTALTDADKVKADQIAQAVFNGTAVNTLNAMNELHPDLQHAALYAAARALGELAALCFGDPTLAVDLAGALGGKAGETRLLSEAEAERKLQLLVIAAKAAAARYAERGEKPRVVLARSHKRH